MSIKPVVMRILCGLIASFPVLLYGRAVKLDQLLASFIVALIVAHAVPHEWTDGQD